MDTFPNRSRYAQACLVVGRVDVGLKRLSAKKRRSPRKGQDHYLEMEVIIASKGGRTIEMDVTVGGEETVVSLGSD